MGTMQQLQARKAVTAESMATGPMTIISTSDDSLASTRVLAVGTIA